jgi:hypothetical protein
MIPNTTDMHPVLLDRFLKWKFMVNESAQISLQFNLTCVLRTFEEQTALYAQARNPLSVVNEYRRKACMLPIDDKSNANKVTWTMQSKHFADINGKGRAFDFALLVPGKKVITWDTKWDADHDGVPEYLECAALAEECGLVSGAFWKTPDIPHIQLPNDVA